jgi:hypothetical protein
LEYYLACTLGNVTVDETEYRKIIEAKKNLIEELLIEESLDFILENYFEFELELLSISTKQMIFNNPEYFLIQNGKMTLIRRISNLLTACKMYLDQCPHHINNIFGNGSEVGSKFKMECQNKYDSSLSYRVMEAIRNYAQHRGMPFQNIIIQYKSDFTQNERFLTPIIVPQISIAEIETDKEFKNKVLREMREAYQDDILDIRPLIREYIERIYLIQESIRTDIDDVSILWEKEIQDNIKRIQNSFGSEIPTNSISLIARGENFKIKNRTSLFPGFIEMRKFLIRKNNGVNNLSNRFVTNRVM